MGVRINIVSLPSDGSASTSQRSTECVLNLKELEVKYVQNTMTNSTPLPKYT